MKLIYGLCYRTFWYNTVCRIKIYSRNIIKYIRWNMIKYVVVKLSPLLFLFIHSLPDDG